MSTRAITHTLRNAALILTCAAAHLFIAGCASTSADSRGKSANSTAAWEGPAAPVPYRSEAWDYPNGGGTVLTSQHYRIRTTVADPVFHSRLIATMEGGNAQYQKLCPMPTEPGKPLECFVFATRPQWASFTRSNTGKDADIYLQITRGGYAIRDWYVAFTSGHSNNYSVAAHEGWHQYGGRHFKGRLPPFLEEGIATTFEHVRWDGDLPRWNPAINPQRAQALRKSLDGNKLFTLDQLMGLHAGIVVSNYNSRIDTFYAQCWAFARFLQDGDDGAYLPGLQRLLQDTAAGTVDTPALGFNRAGLPIQRSAIGPVLERYTGLPMPELDKRYQAYIRKIAVDDFSAQWGR